MAPPRPVTIQKQYVALDLGAHSGMGNATHPRNVPLNASLLVGLHNAYHQSSPLGGIIGSWAYSHPSLFDQLALGYREVELDVHWQRNANSWRVFHVTMLDQVTSCACLTDCISQIRRFMDTANDHSPILVHIEPRGYKYQDLFCERSDGKDRFQALQQLLFDVFGDKAYYPDELISGFPNMYAALQGRGWPSVDALKGRIIFNLNLFSSNAPCYALQQAAHGASWDARLSESDQLARDIAAKAPTSSSIALLPAAVRARKRKLFFNRGTFEQAQKDNSTCSMEVTTSDFDMNPQIFHHGFITRFRIGKKPELSSVIRTIHANFPATLISYDGVWPG